MIKKEGLEDLIGRTINHKYRLKRLIRQTSKSWVFEAVEKGELSPHRKVAIKILKPGLGREREAQFSKEVNTHGKLGEHPNVASLFGSGKDGEYLYAAMELVPGKDLDQRLRLGWKPSLDEILNIVGDVSKGASHIHEGVGGHHDLKSKNIKIREERERKLYVLDLGGRLRKTKDSHDVYKLGIILRELLDHRQDPEQKIPRGLEQIVKKSTRSDSYASPEDFKNAYEHYRRSAKRRISRRKFLKVAGSGLVLSGLGYSGYKYLDYRNSMDYIVKQIEKTEASDYEKIDPLFKELALRIFDKKIRWLIEEDKIPRGKFPYATIENGGWFLTEGGYWTEGFWPGILWNAYEVTGKEKYKQWATEWTRAIDFTERDNLTINPIRFYYSHALGYDITKEEGFLEKALQAADLIARHFNKNGGFLQHHGELSTSPNKQEIQIDTMGSVIPLLCWAYKQTHEHFLKDIIIKHSNATIQCNVNEDGSTIQVMEFNPRTMVRMGGIKYYGFNENSCLSRGQAKAIKGFTIAYRTTNEKICLETAEKCADYFIDNLPEDRVPFYDFKDPNRDIPKDSSVASIASSALLDLYRIIGNEKYRKSACRILKSLSSKNYLSTDLRNYQGLLLHGCSNKNRTTYIDASLIYGDYHFIDSLNKI